MDGCVELIAKSFWLEPSNWWAMFQVLMGLGAVIFVHELGHFLFAKACGVKCEKFYVGFDVPIRLFGVTLIPGKLVSWQWGETEYGVGSIPLGGYVKMLGQDDNPGNIEEQVKESVAQGESPDTAYLESGLVDRTKLDPRSYLAKSVIQRMMIISAGVVFNLLFAVLFAAIAFKTGVDYDPPVIGNVKSGGPAWIHDLTGAEVITLGDKSTAGYYPFMAMAQEIIFNGDERPMTIAYKPYGQDEIATVSVTPQKGFLREFQDLAVIAVSPRSTPVIGELGAIEGNAASQADPPFKAGDTIVEVNQTPIKTDIDLRQVLARDAEKVATFVIDRKTGEGDEAKTERITTKVATNPMRVLGFSVKWKPIDAIKIGSPAEAAGLKIGDEIISINGQPRGDLLTLDKRMIQRVRDTQPVELEILRDGKTETVSITPIIPKLISDLGPDQPVGIDSLGVAIPMTLEVESVQPDGPADKAGLNVGDKLVSLEYLLSEKQKADEAFAILEKDPVIDFKKDTTSWGELSDVLQMLQAGTEIELTVDRNSVINKYKMKTVASDEFFQDKRGITLKNLQWNYKSETWGDAFKYGVLQVKGDIYRVGKTLSKLVRGKISPKHLGGPGTIALAATSEASQSTSRLLLFLTFLSANLAIINFLPIPILDGGHMMFLAYEGILRRPVSERVQLVLTYTGLVMILGLMLFVIFLDLGRFSSMM